jgi:retinol dehydrogenase-12
MGSNSSKAFTAADIPDLSGKTVLITGGNTGLGFASATHLLRANADVILACRSADKAADAKKRLEDLNLGGSGVVKTHSLDLSSIEDAKTSAKELLKTVTKLDIVMLNAGVMVPPQDQKSKDGYELMFAVNHLGHFAFLLPLLPLLMKTDGSRVVCISSSYVLFIYLFICFILFIYKNMCR